MTQDAEYVVVAAKGREDYYVGQHLALYRNGSLIWDGYSHDSLPEILTALGIDFVRREGPGGPAAPALIDGEPNA